MHEMTITRSIIDIALEEARKARSAKITRISVAIGKLSGVESECIRFYFDFMSRGNAAEGAVLDCKIIPAQLECRTCHKQFNPDDSRWLCPHCQGISLKVMAGKDCYVESIEVE